MARGRKNGGEKKGVSTTLPQIEAAIPKDDRDGVTGRFLPGNNGGPGRKPGTRIKLAEAFLKTLLADFEEHGLEAIQNAREASPETYVRVIASILPKEVQAEVQATNILEITDVTARELLASRIAGLVARGTSGASPVGTDPNTVH